MAFLEIFIVGNYYGVVGNVVFEPRRGHYYEMRFLRECEKKGTFNFPLHRARFSGRALSSDWWVTLNFLFIRILVRIIILTFN